MNKILTVVAGLLGLMFLLIGLRWLVDPSGAAGQLGMPLLDDVGRSTQIGDFAAFFLTLGVLILLGLVTSQRLWFYPAAMLLGIAALGRVLAWAVHDAALALDLIAPEVIIAAVLLLAARRLGTTA
ncbi:hypothetical protein SAMN05216271_0618 [Halopseudomonas sabulinigri]|uniref:DUF4345 domain-containing protein n=1 Tax=Halopseudomonas sabulinigri TaxID=472181 RepID=A0A1H1MK61_9GAMM|nr:hypothetical protein [Halopseudomonas sabulinigri]SDR87173.1 hypothetical protein SAMN05216271_0618 [Halopseudomonas sabulinigri]